MEATDLFGVQEDRPVVPMPERAARSLSVAPARRRVILGVDPGLSGGLAFYRPDRPDRIEVYDTPVADKFIDTAALGRLIREAGATEAIVERVGAMPKQGVASTFKFGVAFGAVLGAVSALELPLRLVTPAHWKKHFRLDADKEKARGLAIRQWPSSDGFGRVKDHGRAEAALLAHYAVEVVR